MGNIVNKFKQITAVGEEGGVPVQWGPSSTSLNISGVRRPYIVRSYWTSLNMSREGVWGPAHRPGLCTGTHLVNRMADRQTRLKTLPSRSISCRQNDSIRLSNCGFCSWIHSLKGRFQWAMINRLYDKALHANLLLRRELFLCRQYFTSHNWNHLLKCLVDFINLFLYSLWWCIR